MIDYWGNFIIQTMIEQGNRTVSGETCGKDCGRPQTR